LHTRDTTDLYECRFATYLQLTKWKFRCACC